MVADIRGLLVSGLYYQPDLRTYGHGRSEQESQGPDDDPVVVVCADHRRGGGSCYCNMNSGVGLFTNCREEEFSETVFTTANLYALGSGLLLFRAVGVV